MRRFKKSEGYPCNLIKEILQDESYNDVSTDIVDGLNFVLKNLNDQERELIELRYEKNLTYDQVTEALSISKWSTKNRLIQALRKLRTYRHKKYIIYGLEFLAELEKEEMKQVERRTKAEQNNIKDLSIEDLTGISVKAYICLNNKGLDTIGKLIDFKENNGSEWYRHIPNLTVKTLNEIINIFNYVENINNQ